jgi:hypothetical protein
LIHWKQWNVCSFTKLKKRTELIIQTSRGSGKLGTDRREKGGHFVRKLHPNPVSAARK